MEQKLALISDQQLCAATVCMVATLQQHAGRSIGVTTVDKNTTPPSTSTQQLLC